MCNKTDCTSIEICKLEGKGIFLNKHIKSPSDECPKQNKLTSSNVLSISNPLSIMHVLTMCCLYP